MIGLQDRPTGGITSGPCCAMSMATDVFDWQRCTWARWRELRAIAQRSRRAVLQPGMSRCAGGRSWCAWRHCCLQGDRLWPIQLWPIQFFGHLTQKKCGARGALKGGRPKGGPPKGGPPKGGGPNPEKVKAAKLWGPEGWSSEGWGPEGWGTPTNTTTHNNTKKWISQWIGRNWIGQSPSTVCSGPSSGASRHAMLEPRMIGHIGTPLEKSSRCCTRGLVLAFFVAVRLACRGAPGCGLFQVLAGRCWPRHTHLEGGVVVCLSAGARGSHQVGCLWQWLWTRRSCELSRTCAQARRRIELGLLWTVVLDSEFREGEFAWGMGPHQRVALAQVRECQQMNGTNLSLWLSSGHSKKLWRKVSRATEQRCGLMADQVREQACITLGLPGS